MTEREIYEYLRDNLEIETRRFDYYSNDLTVELRLRKPLEVQEEEIAEMDVDWFKPNPYIVLGSFDVEKK